MPTLLNSDTLSLVELRVRYNTNTRNKIIRFINRHVVKTVASDSKLIKAYKLWSWLVVVRLLTVQ